MHKKNVVIYDCESYEIEPFIKGLNKSSNLEFKGVFQKGNLKENLHRTGKLGDIKRYAIYFWGGFKIRFKAKSLSTVVCWQQFYAICFGFFYNIYKCKNKPLIIACNYTYKKKNGIVGKIYKKFMNFCLNNNAIDYIHIPSEKYAKRINEEFNFPLERIIVTGYGIVDEKEKFDKLKPPIGYEKNGYFLSIGRSNRDYDFLIDAWKGINQKLVIISDTYFNDKNLQNIVIKNDVSADKQYSWINNATSIIISLDDGNIASGDTVLLTAMSLEKIVIVTKPSTLDEMYIENGVNGISVNKDPLELKTIINKIANGELDYIRKNARTVFLDRYSRMSMGMFIGRKI